ncbi:MAG: hypothetical protein VXY99_15835 [Pseudomonadota bacterium]|nr:hypothetical protein [Pseudomonadota bacterium]
MDKKTRRQQVLAKQGVGFRAITRGPWLFLQVAALGQAGGGRFASGGSWASSGGPVRLCTRVLLS